VLGRDSVYTRPGRRDRISSGVTSVGGLVTRGSSLSSVSVSSSSDVENVLSSADVTTADDNRGRGNTSMDGVTFLLVRRTTSIASEKHKITSILHL